MTLDDTSSATKSARTGQYLFDMLPQPDLLSAEENFVASGLKVPPLVVVLQTSDLATSSELPTILSCAFR